jgi:hypothetical protein
MNNNAKILELTFSDDSSIRVSEGHKFIINSNISDGVCNCESISAKDIKVGDMVESMNEPLLVINKVKCKNDSTFDLIEVSGNKYLTNNVISHNCEFLSSDPLLIDSICIAELELKLKYHIREDMGYKFWKNLEEDSIYIIGVDPATGSNEDFSTIIVYDYSDLSLVAIWRYNTMSSPQLYAALKLILMHIDDIGSEVYFSIENNGVGEGVIALYENDENIPENADFISEDGSKRLGMRTGARVKLKTCMTMKQMIESYNIEICSDVLLKELKSYISIRGSYAAQHGATDDIISALLIVIRVLSEMSDYDERASNVINRYDDIGSFNSDSSDYDDNFEPDPFLI